MSEEHTNKEVNKAQDGFKEYMKKEGGTVKRDTIFNDSSSYGKGDVPRNISNEYKNNFEDVFPNAYKPKWMRDAEEN